MSSDDRELVELVIGPETSGVRLDAFLSRNFLEYSRVQLRRMIQSGAVHVDGQRTKPAYRVRVGQRVKVALSSLPRKAIEPEDIPLDILYEDADLVAINKPAGMVVHPSKGHWSGTLTAALAYHFDRLSGAGGPWRPGIVHRLDRDTSGVIVVAKTDPVHLALAAQFEARSVDKEYFAIVSGRPDHDRDWIEQPIGVHPYQREKMAIRAGHPTSRPARTFYEVVDRFRGLATIRVKPKSGRTHQIRVHLAHIGCPVLCDRLYGGRSSVSASEICSAGPDEVVLNRQALHAHRLTLTHPSSNQRIEFEAALPADIHRVLDLLERPG